MTLICSKGTRIPALTQKPIHESYHPTGNGAGSLPVVHPRAWVEREDSAVPLRVSKGVCAEGFVTFVGG